MKNIFIHYIYLVIEYYYVNLIRTKSAFAQTRNAWNLSTKFDLIKNLHMCPITLYQSLSCLTMRAQPFSYKMYYFTIFQMPLNGLYSGRNYQKKVDFFIQLMNEM